MDAQQTRNILEACLLVAGRAMSVAQLEALFESDIDRPDRKEIKLQLEELQKTYEGRGIELIEVARLATAIAKFNGTLGIATVYGKVSALFTCLARNTRTDCLSPTDNPR